MNANEAKIILMLYRPGTADAQDPQIAEALRMAKQDAELSRWLENHGAAQRALHDTFQKIIVPEGLKEQIISEHAAKKLIVPRLPRLVWAVAVVLLAGLAAVLWPRRPADDTLEVFKNQMAGVALRGYGMDLMTNNLADVRDYLAAHHAPSDFILPAAMQKAALVGCAVEGWQNVKVSMVCFRTGRVLPAAQSSDLWLFVVPRNSLKNSLSEGQMKLGVAKNLFMAVWTDGEKVYLLGTEGDESEIRKFL